MSDKLSPFKDPSRVLDTLEAFVLEAQMLVTPADADTSELLRQYVDSKASFSELCASIAKTRVEIARANRLGSSSRSKLPGLESSLSEMLHRRQEIISESLHEPEFLKFRTDWQTDFALKKAKYDHTMDLLKRARVILAKDWGSDISEDMLSSIATIDDLVIALENFVKRAPPPGSMLLMKQEPLPDIPAFQKISASASGLDKMFYGGNIRLAVAIGSPRASQAETVGAKIQRDGLFVDLVDQRPVPDDIWKGFDDILPFSARRLIKPIIPECPPSTSPYSNLKQLLTKESWRSIRDSIIARHNNTCTICGMVAGGEIGLGWRYHEPPSDSHAYGIQELVSIHACCSKCAGVIYPSEDRMTMGSKGVSGLALSIKNDLAVNSSMRRLITINRWNHIRKDPLGGDPGADALKFVVERARTAYYRRSRVHWGLDLKILQEFNLILNEEMVLHNDGWIMKQADVRNYENGYPTHLTRVFNVGYIDQDNMFHRYKLPPAAFVDWTGGSSVAGDDPLLVPEKTTVSPSGPKDPRGTGVVVHEQDEDGIADLVSSLS